MDDEGRRTLTTILDRLNDIHKFIPTVLATERLAKELDGRVNNHERRIIKLEDIGGMLRKHPKGDPRIGSPESRSGSGDSRIDPESTPPPAREKLLTIDPDHTPAGGIKITMEEWSKVLTRFEEQEQHAKWLAEENAKREVKADKRQRQILFWASIASPAGAVAAWALTHFFHL